MTDTIQKVSTNRIVFYSQIQMAEVGKLRALLLEMEEAEDPPAVIYLHLFSYGGDAYAGICGYDIISNCSIPVHTFVEGFVCSAGTCLSIAGTKRYMSKNASFMIHNCSSTYAGSFQDMKVDLSNIQVLNDRLVKMYKKVTQKKTGEIMQMMKDDCNLTAKECQQYGFIHIIQ